MSGTIYTHIDHNIATVTFSHPKSNSFPSELLQKLVNTFNRLSSDDNVKIIVLQSEGTKAFCAGASFEELLAVNDESSGKAFFSGFANLINSMRKCSKLIIGRIQRKVGRLLIGQKKKASSIQSMKIQETLTMELIFSPTSYRNTIRMPYWK